MIYYYQYITCTGLDYGSLEWFSTVRASEARSHRKPVRDGEKRGPYTFSFFFTGWWWLKWVSERIWYLTLAGAYQSARSNRSSECLITLSFLITPPSSPLSSAGDLHFPLLKTQWCLYNCCCVFITAAFLDLLVAIHHWKVMDCP